MSLPECKGAAPIHAYTRKWYNTVEPMPINDLPVCEACFLDNVRWQSSVASNWAQFTVGPYDFSTKYICDMQLSPMAACADFTLTHGMYEKWHHFASLTSSKPMCVAEGITDGEWYGLPDPANPTKDVVNFEICAACHAGWNQSADWGHLFRRLTFSPGSIRLCDFHPTAPRYSDWILNWKQMYLTREPSPFLDYVARLAPTPKCQDFRRVENANWYGDKDKELLICPSCFHETIHGTLFASTFPLQNDLLISAHHCSLYSPRMRQRYAEACRLGSLDALFSFALHREQIYPETVPQLESFLSDQSAGLERLERLRTPRAFSKGVASVSNAFSGYNPIVHNYDMGIMPLTVLVNAEQRKLTGDPTRPAVIEIERRWNEVE